MNRKAEARDRILRAAVDTLATQGFAAATARAIAVTGGFAPGVIYYHFEDLEDVFLAAMRYTSDRRMERYVERTAPAADPPAMLQALRELYAEDVATGHIAAVQELTVGARSSERLAAGVRAEIERWEEYAETLLRRLTAGTPLAELIPARAAATAVMAFYLGLEMLTHLDGDRARGEALFAAAEPLAALLGALLPGPGAPGLPGSGPGPGEPA
ncbi:TetR family transcriptional regulator [Dactylosporangium sp. McL0621]|uniref:TetR family transcriptional regulator n=1 Tax=Dactylosporangium sp. McL0621 TaxID=3415678 RepID=UPI003CEBDC00